MSGLKSGVVPDLGLWMSSIFDPVMNGTVSCIIFERILLSNLHIKL